MAVSVDRYNYETTLIGVERLTCGTDQDRSGELGGYISVNHGLRRG